MKPQLQTITPAPGQSFSVRRSLAPANDRWHFHAELELIAIAKGHGTLFAGDTMRKFGPGDLILLGAHLPHCLSFDESRLTDPCEEGPDLLSVHFAPHVWGDSFLDLPENAGLRCLLEKAKRGLLIEGKAKQRIAALLGQLLTATGMARLLLLMEIIFVLAGPGEQKPLASIGYAHRPVSAGSDRIEAIHAYSLLHFQRVISLDEIAAVANISPNSFCRYFKSMTKKTWSRHLLELRVGHACQLLIENSHSIKQVCYESGFNNFTSFYKYFKLITGKSPLDYQREFTGGIKNNNYEEIIRASYPLRPTSAAGAVAYS